MIGNLLLVWVVVAFAANRSQENSRPLLAGPPIGPRLVSEEDTSVIVRYFYDGGILSQSRICILQPERNDVCTGRELLDTLEKDGVDLKRFYATAYEMETSGGGWYPVDRDDGNHHDDVLFPLPSSLETENSGNETKSRRIDMKLFRRKQESHEWPVDAALAEAASQNKGKLPNNQGYFGVGVVNAKTQSNVGTLWRSAYQLGASFLFTVGARYKTQATDTVQAPTRMPLFELNDWAAFVNFAPRGAIWVAIEMGGTPLEEFQHPRDAIYLLGSEDQGLPKSITRACHEVVSLSSEQYSSYNVAIAGSIVLYDRMCKRNREENL